MGRLRVLLADDQPVVLEGLTKLLAPEYEIAGWARDGLALVTEARQIKPDLIITEVTLPLLNGLEAARRIKRTNPNARIVFLTMHADMAYAAEALKAGGSAFVLKASREAELLTAISEALSGRKFVTPTLAARILKALASRGSRRSKKVGALTRRQWEVLRLVAGGKTLSEIAAYLHISRNTVKSHKHRLIQELQVHTTAGLTQYAFEHQIEGR